MSKSHITQLIVEDGVLAHTAEDLTEDGAISIKSGVVTLSPDLCNTAFTLTLPNPTAGSPDAGGDDFKRLQIMDLAGAAHTVTPATPFGNGGAGEAKATFSGVIGDSIKLLAFGGIWYITGKHQVTVGAA